MFFIIFILFLGYNKTIYNSEPPITPIERRSTNNFDQTIAAHQQSNNDLRTQIVPLLGQNTRVIDIDRRYYTDDRNTNPLHKRCLQFMGGCTIIVLIVGGIGATVNYLK